MPEGFEAAYDLWLAACKRYNENKTDETSRTVLEAWQAVLAIEPDEDKIIEWEHRKCCR